MPDKPQSVFDYASPYDIMVGAWTGHSILYDEKGEYKFTGPSILSIYWKEPGKILRYFQEDLGNLDSVIAQHEGHYPLGDAVRTRAFDLHIDPKAPKTCVSGPDSAIRVQGTESRPGTYLFHLDFPAEGKSPGGNYYNNQYFANPNERHIIGPYVPKKHADSSTPASDFSAVIAQTFTRISYDNIPREFQALEKAHLENVEQAVESKS
jgi:hypothetical protein